MKKIIIKLTRDSWKDSIFRRFIKNSSYLFCGNFMCGLLAVAQSVLLARMLGLDKFGSLAIIIAINQVLASMFLCRIEEFLISFFPKYKENGNIKKSCNIIQISYLVSITAAFFAIIISIFAKDLLSRIFIKNTEIDSSLIMLFSFSLIFSSLSIIAEAFLKVVDSFAKVSISQISERFFSVVALLTVSLFTKEIELRSIIIILIIAAGIRFTVSHYYALLKLKTIYDRTWYNISLAGSKENIKEYTSFLFHSGLGSVLGSITRRADQLWLACLVTPAAAGIYKIAMQFSCFALLPINQLTSSSFPDISRLMARKSIKSLRLNLKRMSLIAFLYWIPAFIFCLFAGNWLIGVLYGKVYSPASTPLLYLLVGVGFEGVFFWNRSLLLSFGSAKEILHINFLITICKILLMPILVIRYGATGAAVCFTTCYVLGISMSMLMGVRKLRTIDKNDNLELVMACA